MMQIDLQSSFLVGSAMALVARRRLRTASDEWLANARNVVLAFGGIVFAPVWLYITLRWPEWETMYRWDIATIPMWLVALFLPLISIAALVGFRVTQRLVRAGKTRVALAIDGLLGASCVAVAILGWERVTFVGTLAEFEAGGRNNLWGSNLSIMFVIATLLVFAPAAALIIYWLRESVDE